MNEELILKEISSSLKKPKVPEKRGNYEAFKAKVDALKELDPSLVTLFRLCDEILFYVDKQEKEPFLLKSIASNMKTLTAKLDSNLRRIDGVQEGLAERIRRFDLLEAKYEHMISNVNAVLGELDRVLKQM